MTICPKSKIQMTKRQKNVDFTTPYISK